ncbi:hypothetical protein O0544_00305 [Edwardsiella anguillarum]|nr:hypothetical protein [Edwardsiella anguillarum]
MQIEISAALRGAHETLDSAQLTQRLAVQQWRDRRMAQALLAAPLPALFITGAFTRGAISACRCILRTRSR